MPWIGSAISAGGSILGGLMGGDGAEDAANAQLQANQMAIAEQRRQYDQSRRDNLPYMESGTAANRRLAMLMGLSTENSPFSLERFGNGVPTDSLDQLIAVYSPQDQERIRAQVAGLGVDQPDGQRIGTYNKDALAGILQKYTPTADTSNPEFGQLTRKFTMADRDADPVYQSGLQFGLDEGRGAINARAIAGGGYDSGATLKALTRFGNDYGSTKANESYNRFTNDQSNTYNKLAGVSGSGQVANQQVGSAGANMANNVSSMLTDGGNARAASIVGGANSWNNAFSGVSNAVNRYQDNQMLQRILAQRGGGWGGSTERNF